MSKHLIEDVDISAFLWREAQVTQGWTYFITGIDRRLFAIEPTVRIQHHGPCMPSGCTWNFWVDAAGKGHGDRSWPAGVERWEVALSYRGPLITALSWSHAGQREDAVTNEKLVSLTKSLATDLGLTYLDAHKLSAYEIAWDELTAEANGRLDYADMPNAFNLLFYEY
jgi:hypothetical protein